MASTNVRSAQIKDDLTDTDIAAANKDGVAGTASMRTLGTGAQQACAGNDSRLSDARTPTAFNGLTAADIAINDLVPVYDTSASANRSVTVSRTGGFISPGTFQARLTVTSATPVTTSDVSGAATLYLTPFRGGKIVIYDGTRHNLYNLSEISVSLVSLTPGIYDIFVFDSGGNPTIGTFTWNSLSTGSITGATNATPISITSNSHGLATDSLVFISGVGGNTGANGVRRITNTGTNTFTLQNLAGSSIAGTGAYTSGGTWWKIDINSPATTRSTGLVLQDGIHYMSGFLTHRYVGTIFVYQTGSVDDSVTNRFVWNYYNRQWRSMYVDQTNSHTYTTAAWRIFNNDFNNQVQYVIGVEEDSLAVSIGGDINSGTGHLAFAPDGVTGTNPSLRHSGSVTNRASSLKVFQTSLGYRNLRMVQNGAASTAYAFAGMSAGIWG